MRRKNAGCGSQDPGDDPTPAEILELCEAIQETWSTEEERRRRTGRRDLTPYEVPTAVSTPRDRHGQTLG